ASPSWYFVTFVVQELRAPPNLRIIFKTAEATHEHCGIFPFATLCSTRSPLMIGKRLLPLFFCFICLTAAAQSDGPLGGISTLRDAITKRSSSFSREGGYIDAVPIKAGQTLTLLDTNGAGSIRHIWMTINSPSKYHLRELVLRMYWDGETDPSVEVPVGDFF